MINPFQANIFCFPLEKYRKTRIMKVQTDEPNRFCYYGVFIVDLTHFKAVFHSYAPRNFVKYVKFLSGYVRQIGAYESISQNFSKIDTKAGFFYEWPVITPYPSFIGPLIHLSRLIYGFWFSVNQYIVKFQCSFSHAIKCLSIIS